MKILQKLSSFLPSPVVVLTAGLFWFLGQESIPLYLNVFLSLISLVPFIWMVSSKWDLKESIIQSFWLNGLFRYTFYFYVFDYYFGMLSYWEYGFFILIFGVLLSLVDNRFLEMTLGFYLFKKWPSRILASAVVLFARETLSFSFLFHDSLGYVTPPESFLGAWSSIGGVPMVSTILFLFSALLVWLIKEPRLKWPKASIFVVLILLGLASSVENSKPSKEFSAVIVQTNEVLKKYYGVGDKSTAEKVYWNKVVEQIKLSPLGSPLLLPELVSPYSLTKASTLAEQSAGDSLKELVKERNQEMFLGFYYVDTEDKVNAIAHIHPDGELKSVEKKELIPFLETDFTSGFSRQASAQELFVSNGTSFAASICFESYRSQTLLSTLRDKNPPLIIQFSDESDVKNKYLHYIDRVTRYRSAESKTPMIRVTKTGYSGTVDSAGKSLISIPEGIKKTMEVSIETVQRDTPTFYVKNQPLILMSSFIVYALFLFSLLLRGRRR